MIRIAHPSGVLNGSMVLPASKSISNRMLILRELYAPEWQLDGLSTARDTQLLKAALEQTHGEYQVQDAGTVMRFLTAFLSMKEGVHRISGTHRMHDRPMGELVEVLRSLGADIRFLERDGYAPLEIRGSEFKAKTIDLRKVRSSQFISAMLMILPRISGEVTVRVDPGMHSWSFVELTLNCMRMLGFQTAVQDGYIRIEGDPVVPSPYSIEPDWTSFYYGFSMAVLSKEADILFPHLKLEGLQSEKKWLRELTHPLIHVLEEDQGLRIRRERGTIHFGKELMGLGQHPDLAPTFAVLFAGLGQTMRFQGLELLQFKESDRDMAIGELLRAGGASWQQTDGTWLCKGEAHPPEQTLDSHDDHRMFMAAVPLALKGPLHLDDPMVCAKSYPEFIDQLMGLGFELEESPVDLT